MLEKLAKQIFDECAKDGEPISMEDALDMAKMELGAKEIKNILSNAVEESRQRNRVSTREFMSDVDDGDFL